MDFKGVKILVVEDNGVNQMVAQSMLKKNGCHVTLANNGIEAISRVKESAYDLIFMDCQMPEMDGYEATGIIKNLMKEGQLDKCPIIALTAHAMAADREKCLQAGMDDYLSKPVRENDFVKMVKAWANGVERDLSNEVELKFIDKKSVESLRELMGTSFTKLIKMYLDSTEKALISIESGLEVGDVEAVRKNAHTIKSPSAQVGALKVSKLASTLEAAAKESNLELVNSIMPDLITAFQEARTELELETAKIGL